MSNEIDLNRARLLENESLNIQRGIGCVGASEAIMAAQKLAKIAMYLRSYAGSELSDDCKINLAEDLIRCVNR